MAHVFMLLGVYRESVLVVTQYVNPAYYYGQ